jgi:hypothetical protein
MSLNERTPIIRKNNSRVYNVYGDGNLKIAYNLADMNLGLVNKTRNTGFVPPKGLFSKRKHPETVNSRFNDGFFPNAKAASMLEHGWRQAEQLEDLHAGKKGLLTFDDEPGKEVEVIEGHHGIPVPVTATTGWTKYGYTFKEIGSEDSKPLELLEKDRHTKWDFYLPTKPVPFTPRAPNVGQRSSKKRKVKKGRKTRKMCRKD